MKHTVKIGRFGCWNDSNSVRPVPDDIVLVDDGHGIVSSFIVMNKSDGWCDDCDMPFIGDSNDASDRLCSHIPIRCQGNIILKSLDTLLESI